MGEGHESLIHQTFQVPKMELLTYISCKAYVRETPPSKWPYKVQYLHFRYLKLLVTNGSACVGTAAC